jgi:glycine/D-amino acid oxidase-like deaminating enzyme
MQGEIIQLVVGEGKHTVKARAAVLATNGYTSKLGFFRNSVSAIHTPMALTPPLSESDFAEIGWNNRIAFSDTYNLLYHLGITPDNRILIGSGHVDYYFNNGVIFRGDENEIRNFLRKELTRIYPGLSGIDFEYFWTGVLGVSLDASPSVGVRGRHKNIYYGLAYIGHGVNLAPLLGKIIADMYAGEGRKWKTMPFYNHRFVPLPPEPLRWVAVRGNIGYYKLVDALG